MSADVCVCVCVWRIGGMPGLMCMEQLFIKKKANKLIIPQEGNHQQLQAYIIYERSVR